MSTSIREWRQRANLSQAEVASALCIDRTAYTRIETGERGLQVGEAAWLFDVLGLTPEERIQALREAAEAARARKAAAGEAA